MSTQMSAAAKPRILVFGTTGQVGHALHTALAEAGEVIALSRAQADFSTPAALHEIVMQAAPNVIINAVAYTAVDQAEREPELAMQINAQAPAVLAQAALQQNAWLIHYSTDYVFDGSKPAPYIQTDPTAPINQYGHSKLAGEQAIQESGCKHLILRTSWVYSAQGQNFLKIIAKRAQELPELRIVNDQYGAPTSAALLATSTAQLIQQLMASDDQNDGQSDEQSVSGLYHLAAAGETNWYDYAVEILRQLAQHRPTAQLATLTPVPGSAYVTIAQRPNNSRLSTEKIRKVFGLTLPDWQHAVNDCMCTLYGDNHMQQ